MLHGLCEMGNQVKETRTHCSAYSNEDSRAMALGTISEASALLSLTETPSEAVALLCMHPTLISRSPWVCTFGLFCMTTRAEMKVLETEEM